VKLKYKFKLRIQRFVKCPEVNRWVHVATCVGCEHLAKRTQKYIYCKYEKQVKLVSSRKEFIEAVKTLPPNSEIVWIDNEKTS